MNQASFSRSSASTSAKRPELLVDKSLGTKAVPSYLCRVGFVVHTVNSVFGRGDIPDEEWMDHAGQHNLVVVCKDERIRRRESEREAFLRNSLRVFCLTNGHLNTTQQVAYFAENIERMDRLWHLDGPWMFGIYRDHITRLKL